MFSRQFTFDWSCCVCRRSGQKREFFCVFFSVFRSPSSSSLAYREKKKKFLAQNPMIHTNRPDKTPRRITKAFERSRTVPKWGERKSNEARHKRRSAAKMCCVNVVVNIYFYFLIFSLFVFYANPSSFDDFPSRSPHISRRVVPRASERKTFHPSWSAIIEPKKSSKTGLLCVGGVKKHVDPLKT